MKLKLIASLAGAVPIALFAFSTGPPASRTGAPVDGGLSCTACHGTFATNPDTRGSLNITGVSYSPGVKQVITVTVKHPDQQRWGFQMIARLASDQTKQAGTFTGDDIVRVRCATTDAPCNGAVEYAEHKNAPRTAVGEGFSFQVTWTPPATDVGNVILYAAGNAANGDGSLNGDRIFTTVATLTPNRPCTLTQKPLVTSVLNGASFQSAIGPGSMISIFGSNFTSAAAGATPTPADLVNNGYPRQFSCVAVEVNGARVPLTYLSGRQINAQAPAGLTAGPAQVRIVANPDLTNQVASDPITIAAQTLSPAFFTYGAGAAAATVINTATPISDPAVIPAGVSAKPGDTISFWATGLGATTPAVPEGDLVTRAATVNGVIVLTIGGISVPPADILYAGLSPGSLSGLFQLNVRLPAGLPDGSAPVALQIAGANTQTGLSIPIKR